MAAVMTVCSGCGGALNVPSLDSVMIERGIAGEAVDILDCLWDAGGLPVKAETLLNAVFDGDPEGGPSISQAYRRLRVLMGDLSESLAGSGYAIRHAGRRQGFRLVIEKSVC